MHIESVGDMARAELGAFYPTGKQPAYQPFVARKGTGMRTQLITALWLVLLAVAEQGQQEAGETTGLVIYGPGGAMFTPLAGESEEDFKMRARREIDAAYVDPDPAKQSEDLLGCIPPIGDS